MIKKIVYTSVQDAAKRCCNKKIIVISILDRNSLIPRPLFKGCRDKLCLSFKDRYEEEYTTGYWPDYISNKLSMKILKEKGERLFDLSDAKKILVFFEQYHNIEEMLELVIHCRSGVSRSAAIAKFLGQQYNIDFDGTSNRFSPNPRILRMMRKVLHLPQEPSE